jgi:hypothetical protein
MSTIQDVVSVFSIVCLSCGSKEFLTVYTTVRIPGNQHCVLIIKARYLLLQVLHKNQTST